MDADKQDLLFSFFADFWSADTSYSPDLWSDSNPSLGQCVPTALLIHDLLGGEIQSGKVFLKNGANGGAIVTDAATRNFEEPKYYYRPIPQQQVLLNNNLKQIFGW